jgi:hypothetical protein
MNKEIILAQMVAEAVRLEVEPLRDEISSLREQIANTGKEIKTIADISREYGYSRRTVERSPWLMPNWGKSDFTGQRKRWKRETYKAWFSVPIITREREWLHMPIKEKQSITRGVK